MLHHYQHGIISIRIVSIMASSASQHRVISLHASWHHCWHWHHSIAILVSASHHQYWHSYHNTSIFAGVSSIARISVIGSISILASLLALVSQYHCQCWNLAESWCHCFTVSLLALVVFLHHGVFTSICFIALASCICWCQCYYWYHGVIDSIDITLLLVPQYCSWHYCEAKAAFSI